ncbi:unnamed protein product [Phytomonas sp. Hart1]|nr:unnamed protein product [Phytomonas sp. Hart1]|eukprot:CCW72264.1 unnamed protein product [Phytomonas sp. isolate Hart1]
MPTESCRWYPDSVIHYVPGESYRYARGKYRNPYDLATKDAEITSCTRVDRKISQVVAVLNYIHPKFRGLVKGVKCDFVLRSSITQLGVNADNVKISIDRTKNIATITLDLVAISPLAVLTLDHIAVGAFIGKIFAIERNRVVSNPEYITRLLESFNPEGQRLLMYGQNDQLDWDLKIIDNRVIAFLPVLPGVFTFTGEIHDLLPTIGVALKKGVPYKDLIRLHQQFNDDHTRVCTTGSVLKVRGYAMHFRTLFGYVVDEYLPPGLHSMGSRVIEPEDRYAYHHLRDRTFVFYGDSTTELTHIPIEFYTLESYREQVPFALRKTLATRCANPADILHVFKKAPKGNQPCCAYLCKGGQFYEMTKDDWIVSDPKKTTYAEWFNPDEQRRLVKHYIYQQPEYSILSAIASDDITSDGVLATRYFPSPCLKSLILSSAVCNKLRAIFFCKPSRQYGDFFSQEDVALLGDFTTFGISVFNVNESSGEVYQYIRRPERNTGQFVPLERRHEYLNSTMFGVYGSNLIAGDFEAELIYLLNGILQIKKTCKHPLLNPTKPLSLVTGGGPGAMEVGNHVAKSLGILSCGLIVDFRSAASVPGSNINEQRQNPYVESFFAYRCNNLVERQSDFNLDFPIFLIGGIGTDFEYALEEVNRKVGAVSPTPIILFGAVEYWTSKISYRYHENCRKRTIKGSEWLSTIPWVVSTGKEALEVYRDFFDGVLPIGAGHPVNERGFMIARDYLLSRK